MNFIKRHFKFTFCVCWFTFLCTCILDKPHFNTYEMHVKLKILERCIDQKFNDLENKITFLSNENVENLNDLRRGLKEIVKIQFDYQQSFYEEIVKEIENLKNYSE